LRPSVISPMPKRNSPNPPIVPKIMLLTSILVP
jgi:hypothetical protein